MMFYVQRDTRMRTSGMTLIEIIIVVTIIGLFAGLAGPGLFKWIRSAKENKTKVRLTGLKSIINQYKEETGQYPSVLLDLVTAPSEPKVASRWRGPYLEDPEKDLQDGWGSEFVYRRNPSGSGSARRPFELYSWGQNGESSPQEEWVDVWSI